jgi:hypothetical protein
VPVLQSLPTRASGSCNAPALMSHCGIQNPSPSGDHVQSVSSTRQNPRLGCLRSPRWLRHADPLSYLTKQSGFQPTCEPTGLKPVVFQFKRLGIQRRLGLLAHALTMERRGSTMLRQTTRTVLMLTLVSLFTAPAFVNGVERKPDSASEQAA